MQSKRKVALFVSSLDFGGAERVVSHLSNELTKYFDVTLILLYNNIEYPLNSNVKVIALSKENETHKRNKIARFKDYYQFIFKYQKVLKNENIDLVISFMIRQNMINGIAKTFNPNLKTIISERCFPSKRYLDTQSRALLTKTLIPFLYNKNNKLFSNSVYINKDLIENFKIKIDSHVIYNPIQIDNKEPHFNYYHSEKDIFNTVTVGRLIPIKNQKSILGALKTLPEHVCLDVFGDGELKKELANLSEKNNLTKRVIIHGNVSNIKSLLTNYHCFILSSLSEGFPNAILEAMSVGLPVISTNCMSGPLELLNENIPVTIEPNSFYKAKYGILVNVDDVQGLANAIEYLQQNNAERSKYSLLGIKRSKDYSIEIIGLQLKNLIDSI